MQTIDTDLPTEATTTPLAEAEPFREIIENGDQKKNKKGKKKKGKAKANGEEGQAKDDDEKRSDATTPLKNKLYSSFYEDQDSSEDEGMPDYKIGGYHPVHVGEVLLDRYVIIQKLGWGHFSTVWLTKDLKYNSYVALKVQKSAQHYLEAAYDEVEILDKIASNWKTDEWKESIKGHYKGSRLEQRLEDKGFSSEISHCA